MRLFSGTQGLSLFSVMANPLTHLTQHVKQQRRKQRGWTIWMLLTLMCCFWAQGHCLCQQQVRSWRKPVALAPPW